jgi:polyisoprenoid-binding protein YceI
VTLLSLHAARDAASPTTGLGCRIVAELPPIGLAARDRASRGSVYQISSRAGPLRFGVDHLGLFIGSGEAHRFSGRLSLHDDKLAINAFEFTVEPEALSLTWRDAAFGMQPDQPTAPIRFRSTAAARTGPGRGTIRGLLEIDHTQRLQNLDVALAELSIEPITGTEIAVFDLTFRLPPDASGFAPFYAWIEATLRLRVELDDRA